MKMRIKMIEEDLVDAVIAFSVIYKGFENLDGFKRCFSINAPNLILMVFIFGLIHGFGLSTKLQEMATAELSLSQILSFNVGVELGQIGALLLIFPLLLYLNIQPSFKLILGFNVSQPNNLLGAEIFRLWDILLL